MIALYQIKIAHCGACLARWDAAESAVDATTRARIDKIAVAEVRQARLVTHRALRACLTHHFGRVGRDGTLIYDPSGRPRHPKIPCTFSISYAEGAAMLAISDGGRLGIDIEHENRRVSFAAERQSQIIALASKLLDRCGAPNSGNLETVLQAWVCLEAVAKATGLGIGHLLSLAQRRVTDTELWDALDRQQPSGPPAILTFPTTLSRPYVAAICADHNAAGCDVIEFPDTTAALTAFVEGGAD